MNLIDLAPEAIRATDEKARAATLAENTALYAPSRAKATLDLVRDAWEAQKRRAAKDGLPMPSRDAVDRAEEKLAMVSSTPEAHGAATGNAARKAAQITAVDASLRAEWLAAVIARLSEVQAQVASIATELGPLWNELATLLEGTHQLHPDAHTNVGGTGGLPDRVGNPTADLRAAVEAKPWEPIPPAVAVKPQTLPTETHVSKA